jgi:hypothetical protein
MNRLLTEFDVSVYDLEVPLTDLSKLDGIHVIDVLSDGKFVVPANAHAPGYRKMVAILVEVPDE